MFKKTLASLLSAIVLATLLSTSAFAVETTTSVEYSEAEIDAMWEDARNQPILPDKSVNTTKGSLSVASFGTYPTRKGVILVTSDKYKGLIPTGHAAIIYSSDTVVESIENGVTTGDSDWNQSKTECFGVTVYGTTTAEDSQAANWCYNQIGKPYNWNYPNRWTRDSFYCSQLVYASFLDNFGIDLDTAAWLSAVHPMELVNSSNTYTIYEK